MSRVGLCSVLSVSEPVTVGAAQGPDDGFHLVAAGLRLAARSAVDGDQVLEPAQVAGVAREQAHPFVTGDQDDHDGVDDAFAR
jgi:hypothetical protein